MTYRLPIGRFRQATYCQPSTLDRSLPSVVLVPWTELTPLAGCFLRVGSDERGAVGSYRAAPVSVGRCPSQEVLTAVAVGAESRGGRAVCEARKPERRLQHQVGVFLDPFVWWHWVAGRCPLRWHIGCTPTATFSCGAWQACSLCAVTWWQLRAVDGQRLLTRSAVTSGMTSEVVSRGAATLQKACV